MRDWLYPKGSAENERSKEGRVNKIQEKRPPFSSSCKTKINFNVVRGRYSNKCEWEKWLQNSRFLSYTLSIHNHNALELSSFTKEQSFFVAIHKNLIVKKKSTHTQAHT